MIIALSNLHLRIYAIKGYISQGHFLHFSFLVQLSLECNLVTQSQLASESEKYF